MSTIYQTPITVIGGQGGSYFSYNAGANGRILRRIGVWAGEWFLGGIRTWWTGLDNPVTFGTANSGSYQEFTFEDGERITRLSLWGNGAGTRSGGIRFYTTTGREFFHYMTSWGLKQEYPIDVASGLCIGLVGWHGEHIDSVGFVFLRSIASARMIDVSYPTLGLETAGIVPVTLDSLTDRNESASQPKNWSLQGSRVVSISSTWETTAGIELHATVSVSAGIPTIAEVSAEYGWTVSTSSTHSTTNTEERTLTWSQSGELLPGQWVSVQVLTRRGTITLPYQATMQITLQNGAVFSYPISSLYAGVDYTDVQITSQGTRSATVQSGRMVDASATAINLFKSNVQRFNIMPSSVANGTAARIKRAKISAILSAAAAEVAAADDDVDEQPQLPDPNKVVDERVPVGAYLVF